jgi:hypothetical protein
VIDVDVTDTHTTSKSYNGDATWSGGSLTLAQIATPTTTGPPPARSILHGYVLGAAQDAQQ